MKKIIVNEKGTVYELNNNKILINKNTSLFKNNCFKTNYKKNIKNIKIIHVLKEIEQINVLYKLIYKYNNKYILIILSNIYILDPLTYFIKKNNLKYSLNIEYPIKILPIYYTFYHIFKLLLNRKTHKKFIKSDIINFIQNGYIQKFFFKKNILLNKLNKKTNSTFVKYDFIKKYLLKNDCNIIFETPINNVKKILCSLINFIKKISKFLQKNIKKHNLEIKFIYYLELFIKKIKIIFRRKKFLFFGIEEIYNLYKNFFSRKNIVKTSNKINKIHITGFTNFLPKKFDITIVLSFNDGNIPPKKKKSLLTLEVIKKFGIDKINEEFYSYNLEKIKKLSKKIFLIYKNNPDDINSGEISSIVNKLLLNYKKIEKNNKIHSYYVKRKSKPFIIYKTKNFVKNLLHLISNGISPTFINLYNFNPILFYCKKVLGLKNIEEKSKKMIIGNIIHEVLKILYTPIIGSYITVEKIINIKSKIENTITKCIVTKYKKLLINIEKILFFHVIKNYINNFVLLDEKLIKKKKKIFIENIEYEISISIKINSRKNIKLRGIIDRIDKYNGIVRILDYKIKYYSIEKINISLNEVKYIFNKKKYSNIMQLLFYVFLWFKDKKINEKINLKIIIIAPIKNNISQINFNFFNKKNNFITFEDYKVFFYPHLIDKIVNVLYNEKKLIIEKIL